MTLWSVVYRRPGEEWPVSCYFRGPNAQRDARQKVAELVAAGEHPTMAKRVDGAWVEVDR